MQGGHVSILTEEGDLQVELLSMNGKPLKPLPLKDCSVSPKSPFNLLSISQLNRDNINVRMSNRGDYLEFDGHRFRCIRLHGLYMIDLLKPLTAYTKAAKVKTAMVSFVELEESFPLNFGGLSATLGRWHDRLGHVSTKGGKYLAASGRSEGLHVNKDEPHRPCRGQILQISRINNPEDTY